MGKKVTNSTDAPSTTGKTTQSTDSGSAGGASAPKNGRPKLEAKPVLTFEEARQSAMSLPLMVEDLKTFLWSRIAGERVSPNALDPALRTVARLSPFLPLFNSYRDLVAPLNRLQAHLTDLWVDDVQRQKARKRQEAIDKIISGEE